jgi:hypothetical protein
MKFQLADQFLLKNLASSKFSVHYLFWVQLLVFTRVCTMCKAGLDFALLFFFLLLSNLLLTPPSPS